MAVQYASLSIGGVDIDMHREATEISVATPPLRRSTIRRASDGTALRISTAVAQKRGLQISATSLFLPDLSAVDFTQPVIVQWLEKEPGGGQLKAITILSDGLEGSQDTKSVRSSWTLSGEEV